MGIVASVHGGAHVDFHDMSIDVLQDVTSANIAMNCVPGVHDARFLVGDWQHLTSRLKTSGIVYDVVLAAEAIYKEETYDDLTDLLNQCLSRRGVAWFAGKRFYFGCGGGTASFAA